MMWKRPTSLLRWLFEALTVGCFGWALINRAMPTRINADHVLLSLMSLRNVTPFYWGQDRYANLLPAAASLVRDPLLNLAFILAVLGSSFILTLRLLASGVSRMRGPVRQHDTLLSICVCLWLGLTLLNDEALFVFGVEPYAFSCVLFAAGVLLARAPVMQWHTAVSAAVLVAMAVAVNPSVLLLLAGAVVLPPHRLRGVVLLLVGLLTAWISSRVASGYSARIGYTDLRFSEPWQHIGSAFGAIVTGFDSHRLAGLFLVLALVIVGRLLGVPWLKAIRLRVPLGGLLAAFLWTALLAQHPWIQRNGFAFRYMYVAFFAVLFAFSFTIVTVLQVAPAPLRFIVLCGLLLDVGSTWPAKSVPLREYTVIAKAFADLELAPDKSKPLWLAGDYWRVWPALWVCLVEGRDCVGSAYRHEGDDQALVALSWRRSTEGANALCLGAELAQCKQDTDSRFACPLRWSTPQLLRDSQLLSVSSAADCKR